MLDAASTGEPSVAPARLQAFAYGEHLEGPGRRSLGFRMLAPAEPEPWSNEVETLARRLQSAPYPDHWPTTDLFCSVLLDDGQRLVAVARYGIMDHTATQRRGGLELVGVIGPNSMSVTAALGIYQWLRASRREMTDLREWKSQHDLLDVLADAPAPPPMGDPVPVLPIKLWQEGALIFAATAPSDPDLRLSMLEQSAGGHWQWLPLVGADFPLTVYAHRGPLVAWSPHIAGVALKLNQSSVVAGPLIAPAPPPRQTLPMFLLAGLLALGLGNLFVTWSVRQHLANQPVSVAPPAVQPANEIVVERVADDAEAFARLLHRHLVDQRLLREEQHETLLRQYDRMVMVDHSLKTTSREAKLVIGLLGKTDQRSPTHIRNVIREVGAREFNPQVIELLGKLVYQRLTEESE